MAGAEGVRPPCSAPPLNTEGALGFRCQPAARPKVMSGLETLERPDI